MCKFLLITNEMNQSNILLTDTYNGIQEGKQFDYDVYSFDSSSICFS